MKKIVRSEKCEKNKNIAYIKKIIKKNMKINLNISKKRVYIDKKIRKKLSKMIKFHLYRDIKLISRKNNF